MSNKDIIAAIEEIKANVMADIKATLKSSLCILVEGSIEEERIEDVVEITHYKMFDTMLSASKRLSELAWSLRTEEAAASSLGPQEKIKEY